MKEPGEDDQGYTTDISNMMPEIFPVPSWTPVQDAIQRK